MNNIIIFVTGFCIGMIFGVIVYAVLTDGGE